MSALAQCDAFAYIYDQAGDPAPDVLVVLKRVLDASGNPILLGPKTTLTDSAGSFHFTLPEFATAFISARASALWNCPDGRAFTVPPGPSGELVPDFSLPPSTLVEPPLVYVGDVLSIPKASETQDGYLSAADYVAFLAAAGADVGITSITAGTGLTGGTITDTGTIALATIPGVAGTYSNPSSITVNAYGQIIAIAGVADTTAPVISAISSTSITSSGATILWTTDDPSDSQVEYGTTTGYGSTTTLATTPVTSHSVPITGTAGSTLYHYRVKSRNTSGLLTTSGDNTFTTTAVVDTTAPVISAISSGSPTHNAATITWTTDDASDSQVEYGLTTSYGSSTTLDATMVTSHSVPLAGLTPSTPYHYRVKSRNAASLITTSADNTFTTTAGTLTLTDGLVSYWALDSDFTDAVGSNDWSSTLITKDAPGPRSVAIFVPGKVGNCASAADSLSYLNQPDNPTFDFSAASGMSIVGWINMQDPTDGSRIPSLLNKWTPANPKEFQILWNRAGNEWEFAATTDGTDVTSQQVATATPAAVAGTWYFIAGVIDHGAHTMKLWTGSGTTLNSPVSGGFTGTVHHGSSTVLSLIYPGALAQGKVDEIGIWNRALSAGDVAALFNGGAGLNPLA